MWEIIFLAVSHVAVASKTLLLGLNTNLATPKCFLSFSPSYSVPGRFQRRSCLFSVDPPPPSPPASLGATECGGEPGSSGGRSLCSCKGSSSVGHRFGPSGSRVRFPAGVTETAAATWLRNKSFWARPHLVSASLRCRWQVHGGGTSRMEPLFRSRSVVACRLWSDEVVGLVFQGCGCCGSQEDGSSLSFLRQCSSSSASLLPRSTELGAWPRPMGFQ
jgi:hypothetical protein